MSGMDEFGVSPEQGPPLTIPFGFFLLANLAVIVGGVITLTHSDIFAFRELPWTMALMHVGTLGFLGAIMLGSLYQMLAVVASPVPWIRVGHLVLLLLLVGTVLLVWAFSLDPSKFAMAWHSLTTAFVLFLGPVIVALVRSETRTTTVVGIMFSVVGLISLLAIGVIMARYRASFAVGPNWLAWVHGHLALGAVVWIGGLLSAVSWQVIPMFYLTDSYPRSVRVGILAGIAITTLAIIAILITGQLSQYISYAALPGLIAVWLVHPLVSLRLLSKRRRKRNDYSLRFWQAGLVSALIALVLSIVMSQSSSVVVPVLLGWTVVWGWAGMIFHGMLSRIVTFLVWFHRYSFLVGIVRAPPMRKLWPEKYLRITLILHATTYLTGMAAIVGNWAPLTIVTGVGLVCTGVAVMSGMLRVMWHMRGKKEAEASSR